jgi:hypothetical protein
VDPLDDVGRNMVEEFAHRGVGPLFGHLSKV